MGDFKDVIATKASLPFYLAELLQTQEDTEITLVHRKNEKFKQSPIACEVTNFTNNSTLNLTGCPLEIDLNVVPSSAQSPVDGNFSFTEVEHPPISLRTARKFLKNYKSDKEEPPKMVYCLCDGTDDENTVIIGSYQFGGDIIRTLVFTQGCVSGTYPQNNINSMMQRHTENTGMDYPKITTKVSCTYELYGYQFRKTDLLENLENNGSIVVKASWNTSDYAVPSCGASIQMLLQVVSGHERSNMYVVYEEIKFINTCLEILARDSLDDSIISETCIDVVDLKQTISGAVHKIDTMKPLVLENLKDIESHFEGFNILDKVWTVFKCCQNASDLKFCLDYLFELVGSTVIRVFDDEKNTVIGQIINEISAGRMIVPYLSPKQSLQLIIDMGLKRLLTKCVAVIKLYDLATGNELLKSFMNADSFALESRRSTLAELDVGLGQTQLKHLQKIYIVLEFLQLVEQNYHFSKDVSVSVVRNAYNKHILNETSVDSLQENQLFNLTVPLTYSDIKSIENNSFVKWQITLSTNMKNTSVMTSYNFSKRFIFPNIVNKNSSYDGDKTETSSKYFVTRMDIYKDKIF